MKLNEVEFVVMNSFLRKAFLQHVEFRIFKSSLARHGFDLHGKVILDAGCGSGYSTALIEREYSPPELTGFDLMPEQIDLAKKRKTRADFFVRSIDDTKLPSGKYDAVFVFGVLHHVPTWRDALKELSRVLKVEGLLLIEEGNRHGVDFADKYIRTSHPQESRFEWSEFIQSISDADFKVLENRKIIMDFFRSFLCVKLKANNA